jgi:hypothetical protein
VLLLCTTLRLYRLVPLDIVNARPFGCARRLLFDGSVPALAPQARRGRQQMNHCMYS